MTEPTQPTARQFGAAVRKFLKQSGADGRVIKVTAETTDFSGLGYGSGIFAEILCSKRLLETTLTGLRHVRDQHEDRASEGNHFIIELRGEPYPFGGVV